MIGMSIQTLCCGQGNQGCVYETLASANRDRGDIGRRVFPCRCSSHDLRVWTLRMTGQYSGPPYPTGLWLLFLLNTTAWIVARIQFTNLENFELHQL